MFIKSKRQIRKNNHMESFGIIIRSAVTLEQPGRLNSKG
jgi:hypothetical protein